VASSGYILLKFYHSVYRLRFNRTLQPFFLEPYRRASNMLAGPLPFLTPQTHHELDHLWYLLNLEVRYMRCYFVLCTELYASFHIVACYHCRQRMLHSIITPVTYFRCWIPLCGNDQGQCQAMDLLTNVSTGI
jgi:hypothetical protein